MGLYDRVDYETDCPQCGAIVDGFQTKDGDPYMNVVKPGSVNNFYSKCDNCNAWIDLNRIIPPTADFTISWRKSAHETPIIGLDEVSISQPPEPAADEEKRSLWECGPVDPTVLEDVVITEPSADAGSMDGFGVCACRWYEGRIEACLYHSRELSKIRPAKAVEPAADEGGECLVGCHKEWPHPAMIHAPNCPNARQTGTGEVE